MSLDNKPPCHPRLYEPAWTPTNGVPMFRLCVECGRGTVRQDLHGVPHCHGPLPEEPLGWVLTRPGPVEYVKNAAGRGNPRLGDRGLSTGLPRPHRAAQSARPSVAAPHRRCIQGKAPSS